MQIFPCPFCGPRDETEFTFGGEAGKVRPEPAADVSAETWSAFLHRHPNPRGASREIWVHNTCGEFFLLERDTVSHAVFASHSLRKSGEDAATPSATAHDGETLGTLSPGFDTQTSETGL
ncbi:MAG: sarcosine oxidase subunit delta [Mesorhizobium amorphae]|nr:MAG: sarcosine oxidase subunit delta [Mesorhizobium amorphae]